MRYFVAGILVVLCAGCKTAPEPRAEVAPGARVGIVNGLEPYVTHQHMTVRRVGSFTRRISVDWDIPSRVDRRAESALRSGGRFEVLSIDAPRASARLEQLSDQVGAAAVRRSVPSELSGFIGGLAETHGLDVVVLIQSFSGDSPLTIHDSPVVVQGYGLFTRRTGLSSVGVRNNWVHPYAQVRVVVFATRPVARIGVGRPPLRTTRSVDGFNWPADINNIPQADIERLRPIIEAYVDEALDEALISAGLTR